MRLKSFLGELIGTFILVLIGCGSVGWTILIEPLSLFQIACIWGVGVILAIIAAASMSKSHLNPAVTLAFWMSKDLDKKEVGPYFAGQFAGALVAAATLFLIYNHLYIGRGIDTAMMFGEYYPNPGNADLPQLGMGAAAGLEALGTFLLMFGIYMIIKIDVKQAKYIHPLLIGVLLAVLIFCIAPYTQAGFNPARDFAPRLFSYFAGWDMAFSANGIGFFVVYIFAPCVGALAASFLALAISKK